MKTYKVYHAIWESLKDDDTRSRAFAAFVFFMLVGVSAAVYFYAYGLIDEFLDMPTQTINLILAGAIGYGWYMLLNAEIDSEKFGRELRKKKLDKDFGRLSPEQTLKKFGGDSIDIPLGRVGKPEKKLKATDCAEGLVGLTSSKHKGHVLVAAPTQSGKGLQLTQILESWGKGAVVIDPKGEQFGRLSEQLGSRAMSLPHYSIRLSSFYGLNQPHYTAEVGNNLRILYDNLVKHAANRGEIWDRMGFPLLKACWYYAHLHKQDPIRTFFMMARGKPEKVLPALYEVAPDAINQFAPSLVDIDKNKMLLSGWNTLTINLTNYQDMLDMIAPKKSNRKVINPDFAKLEKMIFITFDFSLMQAQAGLVSAILAGITMNHQRFYGEQEEDKKDSPYMLMAIDELPAVAPVALPSDLATLTSYNVRYLLYIQSVPQLNRAYGRDGAQVLMSNCLYRAFYSANDTDTAQEMAVMMGDTIRVSESYSDRSTDGSGSDGSSRMRGERIDRAMTPSEAMNLPRDQVLLKIEKETAIVQRINIIPRLKNGEYGNATPPKQAQGKRAVTNLKRPAQATQEAGNHSTDDEIVKRNLELIANCTTIEQLKHLWRVSGKRQNETEREAYRKRIKELGGSIGANSGKKPDQKKPMSPENKEDRRTDDDFF